MKKDRGGLRRTSDTASSGTPGRSFPPKGQAIVHESFHSGPLPSAAALAEYEEALPGLADRIVTMAENESAERHWGDRYALRTERWSMYATAVIVMTILIGSGWLIFSGFGPYGITAILSEMASLVYAFRVAKKTKDERSDS